MRIALNTYDVSSPRICGGWLRFRSQVLKEDKDDAAEELYRTKPAR